MNRKGSTLPELMAILALLGVILSIGLLAIDAARNDVASRAKTVSAATQNPDAVACSSCIWSEADNKFFCTGCVTRGKAVP